MFTHILVCSDGSDSSIEAAKIAVELARKFDAKVTLINVFNPPVILGTYRAAWEAPIGADAILSYSKEIQEDIERRAGAIFDQAGIAYTSLRETGHPVNEIVSAAEREKADLIVMGSRGLGGLKSLLLGSVSDGVLHHAHCPVLIAR